MLRVWKKLPMSKKNFESHREGEGALSGIIDRVLVVLPHFGLLLVPTTYDLESDLNSSGKVFFSSCVLIN